MKLINYAFLTDENINPIIVESLRKRGCDIFDVNEQGLSGNTDAFLLNLSGKWRIRQYHIERLAIVPAVGERVVLRMLWVGHPLLLSTKNNLYSNY